MKQTHKIRWVLYHEPIDLFIRTAEAFANEIAKLTDGRIEIEIYSQADYADRFKKGAIFEPLTLMQNNEVEMSQVQVGALGQWNATDFYALELPFLFNSHDHCTRVLEGDIGQSMLSGLSESTPATGLAFTYSGGFRCLAADRAINTVEDLQDLKVVTFLNPVMIETATAFGCVPVPIHSADHDQASYDLRHATSAVETTLPRYQKEANPEVHKFVANTKHSMYLTSIIIATEFWNSLSSEDQDAMRQAALVSSRLERQWSVDDAEKIATDVEQHKAWGITYNEFSEVERVKLKELVEPIYTKYTQFFTPGLVDGIIKG